MKCQTDALVHASNYRHVFGLGKDRGEPGGNPVGEEEEGHRVIRARDGNLGFK